MICHYCDCICVVINKKILIFIFQLFCRQLWLCRLQTTDFTGEGLETGFSAICERFLDTVASHKGQDMYLQSIIKSKGKFHMTVLLPS